MADLLRCRNMPKLSIVIRSHPTYFFKWWDLVMKLMKFTNELVLYGSEAVGMYIVFLATEQKRNEMLRHIPQKRIFKTPVSFSKGTVEAREQFLNLTRLVTDCSHSSKVIVCVTIEKDENAVDSNWSNENMFCVYSACEGDISFYSVDYAHSNRKTHRCKLYSPTPLNFTNSPSGYESE